MLRAIFVWLDDHPHSYWILAGITTLLLFIQIGLTWRQDQRRNTARATSAIWCDALILLLFLFAWRWPFLLSSVEYNPDESQLISGAITLAHDPVFWRSIDGTTSGPLNFYVLLPWHWLGMPLDYFTGRLTGLLLIWGALFACHRALAIRFGHMWAWLGILPAAAFFATSTCNDFIHYSSECVTLLLIAVTIWLLASREKDNFRRLHVACFVAGLAIWAKLQAAPLSVTLVGWGIWQVLIDRSTPAKFRFKQAAQAALAAISPSVAFVAVIVATGQTETAYQRYFLQNLFYIGKARPINDALREMISVAMVDGRLPWLLAIAAGCVTAATIYFIVRRLRPTAMFALGGLLTLAATTAILTPRREFLHYTLLLPIPLSLWLGSALGGWWNDLSSSRHRQIFAGLVFFSAGLPLLVTRCLQPVPSIYGDFAYHWRHPRGSPAEVVNALAAKSGSLGIWGWAGYLYVETGLPQATRDGNTIWSIEPNGQRDYHRACYLADLRQHEPSVFVDAVGGEDFGYKNRPTEAYEIFPELAEYVRSNYTLVTDLGEARIYARRGLSTLATLTPSRLAELTSHPRPANVIAPSITPLDNFQRKVIAERNVVMLLPPTKVEWQLNPDVREVVIGFGFDPFAYTNGKSNGVELIMELVDHEQTRVLYRYYVDPATKPDDRHLQTVGITLPPFAPDTRLIVRTDPGPYGDTAWDWVYLEDLQLKRYPGFISNQFPGFGRVPDFAEATKSTILQAGKERLLLLSGAAKFTYILVGNEKNLQFQYGFLSEQGGNAHYRVELQRARGPATLLWERNLQSGGLVRDVGRQKTDLALGPFAPGDKLILAIEPEAHAEENSERPYLTGLKFSE